MVAQAVASIQADGATDLAQALTKLGQVVAAGGRCPRVIIFTDNMDTCGGDVGAITDKFNQERDKYCMEVDVITSSLDDAVLKRT